MSDRTNDVRRAVIAFLKSATAVSAIVSDRIYDEPSDSPTWPFIRYGLPLTQAYEQSCGSGSDVSLTIHTFARGPGTQAMATLNAAVIDTLTDAELDLSGRFYGVDFISSQIMNDGDETSDYHGVIRFSARVI